MDANTKMGAFIQLLPDVLREHLYMNADRYTTYELMRQAAMLHLEEKQDAGDNDTVPMDVEQRALALERHKSGKGGEKGKTTK